MPQPLPPVMPDPQTQQPPMFPPSNYGYPGQFMNPPPMYPPQPGASAAVSYNYQPPSAPQHPPESYGMPPAYPPMMPPPQYPGFQVGNSFAPPQSQPPLYPPPQDTHFEHSGAGPRFSIEAPVTQDGGHTQEDDTKSVASMDDFEARLAALKRL